MKNAVIAVAIILFTAIGMGKVSESIFSRYDFSSLDGPEGAPPPNKTGGICQNSRDRAESKKTENSLHA